MDTEMLTRFFMWCTIINGGLFTIASLVLTFAPDWAFRMHTKYFPMPRETFTVVSYSFIGFMKILFLVFNLIPFVALLIVG